MDSLSFAAMAASAFPVLFSNNTEHIEVPHCQGIVALSYSHYPCVAVDPEKYPNWECKAEQYYGSLEEQYHSECIKVNTESAIGYYCTCNESPRYSGTVTVKISDSLTYFSPTLWYTDKATGRCPGCRDGHAQKIPCLFCGEVHD